ncbi:Uncharacterised protein [uncultured archaeon]|nr:Uncharacterised protein [uncultured archaeon]
MRMRAPPSWPYFALGGIFGLSSLACPCPSCYAGAAGFSLRGLAEHVGFMKKWMDEKFAKKENGE